MFSTSLNIIYKMICIIFTICPAQSFWFSANSLINGRTVNYPNNQINSFRLRLPIVPINIHSMLSQYLVANPASNCPRLSHCATNDCVKECASRKDVLVRPSSYPPSYRYVSQCSSTGVTKAVVCVG